MSNLGLWEPTYRQREAFPYGTDLTYRLGAEFLSGCQTVEDWGCGTQWFRRVMQQVNPAVKVIGLDGSAGFCDQVVDLSTRVSDPRPDGIFLRHVLEHNYDWRTLLAHAVRSFKQRMVLVLFTPFSETEQVMSEHHFADGGSCPNLSLSLADIEAELRGHGLQHRYETMASPETLFGMETVFWITRPDSPPVKPATPLPFVSCLCPTYHRPKLLANAIACFQAQDYPADRRELIILDDAGQLAPQRDTNWEVVSIGRRFRSLPDKFNALAGLARGEILAVWEDDDIYLPWHLTAHVETLSAGHRFSKPSKVYSHYLGRLQEENAGGRFHASIAFTRSALDAANGWLLTKRADFDQQFMARLAGLGPVGDTYERFPPSYVFRWEVTNAYHGQGTMRSAEDQEWYDLAERDPPEHTGLLLTPGFDPNTRECVDLHLRRFR